MNLVETIIWAALRFEIEAGDMLVLNSSGPRIFDESRPSWDEHYVSAGGNLNRFRAIENAWAWTNHWRKNGQGS